MEATRIIWVRVSSRVEAKENAMSMGRKATANTMEMLAETPTSQIASAMRAVTFGHSKGIAITVLPESIKLREEHYHRQKRHQ